MNLGHLIRVRLASLLRSVFSLIFLIVAVIIGFTAAYLTEEKNPDLLGAALVVEDQGTYGQRLADGLEQENWLSLRLMGREEALQLLRQDRLDAVLIIKRDYTETLQDGKFADILQLYSAPSSRAAVSVSEPVINKTLMLWVEEIALLNVESYLSERHIPFSDSAQTEFRDRLVGLWDQGYGIEIDTTYLEKPAASKESDKNGLTAAVLWYAIFGLFYLLISASWILDMNNHQLKMRARQKGVPVWQLTFISALAPLILTLIGYLIMGAAVCAAFGHSYLDLLIFLPPITLYLIAALGIMLTVTCLLRNITILLFLAPLITFLFSVLSGMIAPLPEWAHVLATIAKILPGSWLKSTLTATGGSLIVLAICALAWLACGAGASLLKEKMAKSNTE